MGVTTRMKVSEGLIVAMKFVPGGGSGIVGMALEAEGLGAPELDITAPEGIQNAQPAGVMLIRFRLRLMRGTATVRQK